MTENKIKTIGELAGELYLEAKEKVPKAEIRLRFSLELQNLKELCAKKDIQYERKGVITNEALAALYSKIRADINKNHQDIFQI